MAMITSIGVPREVKTAEGRVAMTPDGVRECERYGIAVYVETGAGDGASISDSDFVAAGATIVPTAADAWAQPMVVKVIEPKEEEFGFLRRDLTLFTYLHLAAYPKVANALIAAGTTSFAYETVQMPDGSLPLLAPMSEVAGRLAPQMGAHFLESHNGGRGVLMGGAPGVRPAKVVVLGGGVAGTNAIAMAVGLGAEVTVLDTNISRLRELDHHYAGRLRTIVSNTFEIERAVTDADLVIGSVLIPGAKAPKLVTNDHVKAMRPGTVLVDIAIDQGGCFADSHATTHAEPTYKVHDTVFYCVANMPGAVPHTSTYALTNATLPYAKALAGKGWMAACQADASLALGLNTHGGLLVNEPVGAAHGISSVSLESVLA